MAGFAGNAAGVGGGINLRKVFGFGGAGGVAAGAEDCCIKFGRDDVGGIGGVFGERTVAGFAVDAGVFAFGLGVLDVGVAIDAGLVAGEGDWVRGDLSDGRGSIMAVLAEGFRNYVVAHDEKNKEGDDEESGKAEEMSCIFEEIHEAVSP